MNRSGPLERHTPLNQGSQLTRKSRIANRRETPRRQAEKPKRTKVSPLAVPIGRLRELLAQRSGGWCEARLPMCQGRAAQLCHRVTKGKGGRPLKDDQRLCNVWHGCAACHEWTHHRPTEAKDLGLMLENWQDPATEPMAYHSAGMVVLDDDGTLWPFGGAA